MTDIQTICLFRRKEADSWSVFLLEFFKLIGCIVYDCVWSAKDEDEFKKVLYEDYDIIILWDLLPDTEGKLRNWAKDKNSGDKDGTENKEIQLIPVNGEVSEENVQRQDFIMFTSANCKCYLKLLIDKIWNGTENKDISFLGEAYIRSRLFFYCYNKGNLKFVQEYYPLNGKDGRIAEKRKLACLSIYNQYAECYNDLMKYAEESTDLSYYYKYALVNIRYELNSIRSLGADRTIFYTDQLLKQAERIKRAHPDEIRIHFLVAKICKDDDSYLWEAEFHFLRCINKFFSQYRECRAGDFLYYQFAKYYEKSRKENEKAAEYYQMAKEVNNQSYRAIYKLAKAEEQKKNYLVSNNLANDIIHVVLNGYKIRELMPKQQIYIYKCYVLLGDIFVHTEQYDLAVISYRRALKVAETEVDFFNNLKELTDVKMDADDENWKESEEFERIVKACMPKQPVYLKIISNASKIRNMDLVSQYQKKLLAGES